MKRAKELVERDRALAIMTGAMPRDNFGSEYDDFGDDDDDFGDDDDDFGDDDFGAAAKVSPSAALRVYRKAARSRTRAKRRSMILNPNAGSAVKVERYAFTISQALTLGTASTINMTGQPDTRIRPQRVTMNAPTVAFATVDTIKVANVNVTVGPGSEDAFNYSPLGQGMSLDMPTMEPANRATVTGSYTGFVPPGHTDGSSYTFSATFRGPSSVVA